MKFNCGPTWEEEKARLSEWHPFFALWPRRVGSGDCRWLETIERRGTLIRAIRIHISPIPIWMWTWEYRALS